MPTTRKAAPVQDGPAPSLTHHLPRSERYAMGKAMRAACPRAAHAVWKAPGDRPDAVDLVLEAEKGRMAELLPLRHGRMVKSAFTFYRGAALTMATDLARTPASGINLQCCGDAHLCNFGGFATPERNVIFAINDLDETHPAPWEWDLKRLVASFVLASRDNGLGEEVAEEAVLSSVRSYREQMAEFSQMKALDLWYFRFEAEGLIAGIADPEIRHRVVKRMEKERGRSMGEELFPKLVQADGEYPVIRDQLPTIFHLEGHTPGEVHDAVREAFLGYRKTLHTSYRALLDRFELKDVAIKVVGVGSVGTMCWVLLLMAGQEDPLFLQIKEARASVLEPHTQPSEFPNHGQRVVHGYRLMQPASDMFLGWSAGRGGRHFFFRQLRDIKLAPRVEVFGRNDMVIFAQWCGQALALAHARSGDSVMLSGYLGKSDTFDQALAKFAVAYADQNEKDHAALKRAVRSGKVEAVFEAES